jgi:hypothetical protein
VRTLYWQLSNLLCPALLCSPVVWYGVTLEASVALLLCKMLMELMELMNADVCLWM